MVDPSYQPLWQLRFPEDYCDSRARCQRVVQALVRRHAAQNMLLVGHGLSVEYLVSQRPDSHVCCVFLPSPGLHRNPERAQWWFNTL